MRMVGFYVVLLSLLPLLGLTDAGQEAIRSATFSEPSPLAPYPLAHTTTRPPVSTFLSESDLSLVSSSVVAAEDWLRTHVLARFPSNRVATVVVGKGVLCHRGHKHHASLVLPSVRNLHSSLVNLGLEKVVKVSVAFSSYCLHHPQFTSRFRDDLEEDILRPPLKFLRDSKLLYSIDPSPHSSPWVAPAHRAALRGMGFAKLKDVRMLSEAPPRTGAPPPRVPVGERFAPSVPFAPVPGSSLAFVPSASPSEIPFNSPSAHPHRPPPPPPPRVVVPVIPVPATPPAIEVSAAPAPTLPDIPPVEPPTLSIGYPYPPSMPTLPETPPIRAPFLPLPPLFPPPTPSCSVSPAPGTGVEPRSGLWCVAKPAVPAEKLQEALDYACGEGEADCEAIGPNGSCYDPDTPVAHASYAFNSYWQKAKQSGGTCSFDGTAILTDSDPSYRQCHYVVG